MRYLLLGAVGTLCSCLGPSEGRGPREEQWQPLVLHHARGFTIDVRGNDRRLTVFGPGGRTDTVGIHVLSSEVGKDAQLPPQRLALVSTTHLPYIQALGKLDVVVGAAHLDRIVDKELVANLPGRTVDIGTADGLDRERLIALAPDALLDYPFGRPEAASHQFGIRRIAITEYLEEHPLGRAEWLRFFGVLLGCEQKSDSLFELIRQRYSQEVLDGVVHRPQVFFGSVWQGQWFVPSNGSYMSTLVNDAGGELLFGDREGGENIAVDLETVLDACGSADHFGVILAKEGAPDAMELVGGDARLASLRAVRQGGFHGNSANSDLFGKALLEPDRVLIDLACIFHPERCSDHVPRYFAPIAQ